MNVNYYTVCCFCGKKLIPGKEKLVDEKKRNTNIFLHVKTAIVAS